MKRISKIFITMQIFFTLALSIGANASDYHCESQPGSEAFALNLDPLLLRVHGDKITIIDISDNPTTREHLDGILDIDYQPRGNTNYARFTGFNNWTAEGYINVLIESELLDGASEGKLKLQWIYDTFDQDYYYCVLIK